ncbi:MAG: phosphatase PAP2 family protein [Bacteroidota bacterium]
MLQKIHDTILYWDYTIWYYVNTVWHNSYLDAVIPFLRNQWFWAPLYLFLLIFMPMNYGKKGWIWCLGFLITFALCDHISAAWVKPFFHRLRPCNDPYLSRVVHIIVPCGSGYSFPSSHATNHFGMGTFSAITMYGRVKGIMLIAFLWAFSVSYAQVYVGVHFPLDVTVGATLGICIGILTGKLFNFKFKLSSKEIKAIYS